MGAAAPEQLSASVKSPAFAPASEIALSARAPLPEFVTVTLTAALGVPTAWFPKLMLAVESATAGCVALAFRATS